MRVYSFFIFLFVFIAAQLSVLAQSSNLIPTPMYSSLFDQTPDFRSMSVVSVNGHSNGIPVKVQGETMILTNSHVLKGRAKAQVYLTPYTAIHFPGISSPNLQVNVELAYDFPRDDFALLKILDSNKLTTTLDALSSTTVSFCLKSDRCERGFQTFKVAGSDFTGIISTYKGGTHNRPLLPHFKHHLIPDTKISGRFEHIYQIPLFTWRGQSGSGFYVQGELKGLLTEANLGIYPVGYAIPIKAIADIIQKRIFERVLSNSSDGYWNSSKQLEWNDKSLKLPSGETLGTVIVLDGGNTGNSGGDSGNSGGDSGNSGGDSGNSGGDSGNSGGDSGNSGGDSGNSGGDSGNSGGDSGGWFMSIFTAKGIVNTYYHGYSKRKFPTANPFTLTGARVRTQMGDLALLITQSDSGKELVVPATHAGLTYALKRDRLVSFYREGQKREISEKLIQTRKTKSSTPRFRYGRMYLKEKPNRLRMLFRGRDTLLGDGAQSLFRSSDQIDHMAEYKKQYESGFAPNRISWKSWRAPMEWEGIGICSMGVPFTACEVTPLHDLYVRAASGTRDDIKGSTPLPLENLWIKIPKNHKHIQLNLGTDHNSPGPTLYPKKDLFFARIYSSSEVNKQKSPYRAITFYDSEDLSQVKRTFIETKHYLYEFISCIPGMEGCTR